MFIISRTRHLSECLSSKTTTSPPGTEPTTSPVKEDITTTKPPAQVIVLISKLKLRFSTGSLGTASFLGSYNSLSLLSPTATVYGTGFNIPSDVANLDLTWQTNTETNFGFDLGFGSSVGG